MNIWTSLKNAIANVIKTNNNQEITGQNLQEVLLSIINTVGAGATFAGVATPEINPDIPEGSVFYIAATEGTYTHFGNTVITNTDQAYILKWDGVLWTALPIGLARYAHLVNSLTDVNGAIDDIVAALELMDIENRLIDLEAGANITAEDIESLEADLLSVMARQETTDDQLELIQNKIDTAVPYSVPVTFKCWTKSATAAYLSKAQQTYGATVYVHVFDASGVSIADYTLQSGETQQITVTPGQYVSAYCKQSGWGASSEKVVHITTPCTINLYMIPIGKYVAFSNGAVVPEDYSGISNMDVDTVASPLGLVFSQVHMPAFILEASHDLETGILGNIHASLVTIDQDYGNANTHRIALAQKATGLAAKILNNTGTALYGQCFLPSYKDMEEIFYELCDTQSVAGEWIASYGNWYGANYNRQTLTSNIEHYLNSDVDDKCVTTAFYDNEDTYETEALKSTMIAQLPYYRCRTLELTASQIPYASVWS